MILLPSLSALSDKLLSMERVYEIDTKGRDNSLASAYAHARGYLAISLAPINYLLLPNSARQSAIDSRANLQGPIIHVRSRGAACRVRDAQVRRRHLPLRYRSSISICICSLSMQLLSGRFTIIFGRLSWITPIVFRCCMRKSRVEGSVRTCIERASN